MSLSDDDLLQSNLSLAMEYHRLGDLFQAGQIYQRIRSHYPDHPDSWHLSGLLAYQQGDPRRAIELINQAVALREDVYAFHSNLGIAYGACQHWSEAEPHYRRALELNPDYREAHYNLGNCLQKQGKLAAAIEPYQRVIALDPGYAEAYLNLGVVWQKLGQFNNAIQLYQQLIEIQPDLPEVYFNLGNVFRLQGQLDTAIIHYQQALLRRPDYAAARENLGYAFSQQERLQEGIRLFEHAIEQNLDPIGSLNQLGRLYLAHDQIPAATAQFQQAIRLDPKDVRAYGNLSTLKFNQNRLDEALDHLQLAIDLDPSQPDPYYQAAQILAMQGEVADALASCQEAYRIRPDPAEFALQRGLIFSKVDRLSEAVSEFQTAIALRPDSADAHGDLGFVLAKQGKLSEAIAAYRQALQLFPAGSDHHFGLATVLLLAGDLQAGFAEYEWRWQIPSADTREVWTQPLWNGSDPRGQTLLLHSEQGLGDTIQFVRYAKELSELGAQVIVRCPESLVRLLQTMEGVAAVITPSDPMPADIDAHVPLLSLPHWLGTTLETIPANVPYVSAPTTAELPMDPGCQHKVGIVWASGYRENPDAYQLFYRRKSCDPSHFKSLLQIPGVNLYSLQIGKDQADSWHFRGTPGFYDLSDRIRDFADTAALIEQMDLVISVDTAVAHLAGSLAKPVWTLLPHAPDWRWMLDRQDCPWYPTMRLFRQPDPGDWTSVFVQVREALRKY